MFGLGQRGWRGGGEWMRGLGLFVLYQSCVNMGSVGCVFGLWWCRWVRAWTRDWRGGVVLS